MGGLYGHLFRRSIHVGMILIPIWYYQYNTAITTRYHLPHYTLLLLIACIVLIIEIVRLNMGWVFFGQRTLEKHVISSFAWGLISIVLVLLWAPEKAYAFPIIISCALGDPVIGELRQWYSNWKASFIGLILILLIWYCFYVWMGTPWLLCLLMPWIIVIVEWPNFTWIDDNALMLLTPLFIILAIQ